MDAITKEDYIKALEQGLALNKAIIAYAQMEWLMDWLLPPPPLPHLGTIYGMKVIDDPDLG
jgi:hypothetical protein